MILAIQHMPAIGQEFTETLHELGIAALMTIGITMILILIWPEKRARPEAVEEHCMDEKQFEDDAI